MSSMLPGLEMSVCSAREVKQRIWLLAKRQFLVCCVVHDEVGSAQEGSACCSSRPVWHMLGLGKAAGAEAVAFVS